MPMTHDAALREAKVLWTIAKGRTRQGPSQRVTRTGDSTANSGSDTRHAGSPATRPTAGPAAGRFTRDHADRRNTLSRSARQTPEGLPAPAPAPAPAPGAVDAAPAVTAASPALRPPRPRRPEPPGQIRRRPADLHPDMDVVRYPPPTQRETLAAALLDLVEESVDCTRCAPPARQAALDNSAIQAILAGIEPATAHDILRIVVACGGTHKTIRTWQRIIRALDL